MRRAEIAYIVLVLVAAGVTWREARRLPPAPYDPLGPGAFPVAVSIALVLLGLAMLARLLAGRSLGGATTGMAVGLAAVAGHPRRPWTAAGTLLLAFAYAGALSVRGIGFLPATAAYLFLSGLLLGPLEGRRAAMVAAFAAAAAVLLDLLFRVLFRLDLT
jgi:tripartite tricarboxylate transporter TctB family protein